MTAATTAAFRLAEAGPGGAHEALGAGRFRLKLIEAGPGSSGFYLEDTLREAAAQGVFSAGTHMYIDHPGYFEDADRERVGRPIRDLAARLVTDGVYRDGAVFAEAEVFSHWRPLVEEMADSIGVSIRGFGEQDRDGNVVSIQTVESVDFVTKAGAGGRVLELIESARETSPPSISVELTEALDRLQEARNVGAWFESRIHLSFTERADDMFGDGRLTREERIGLSSGIGAALDAFREAVEDVAPQLYDRDLFDEPDPMPSPIQTTESKEDPMTTNPNPDLEARLTQLEESVSTLQTERDEAVAARDEAVAERDQLREAQRATDDRDTIATAVGEVEIPETLGHLAESIRTRAARQVDEVPRDSDGNVRTDQLTEAATAAVTAEVEFLTEAVGDRIVGLGEGARTPDSERGDGKSLIEANDERAKKLFGAGSTN